MKVFQAFCRGFLARQEYKNRLRRISTSRLVANGMEMIPVSTSARAKLANRMFELCSFNSLFVFAANTTKMFRRTTTGQRMIVIAAVTLNMVLSLKTQICIGLTGQKYSESTLFEAVTARSVSLEFILITQ